jgi:protein involved in polysaccharide export with SLBB domain
MCPEKRIQRALAAETVARAAEVDRHYAVRFPDVLDIEVAQRPDCSGSKALSIDGRISLTPEIVLAVDGKNCAMIAQEIERRLLVAEGSVVVRVQEYRSQKLYVCAEGCCEKSVTAYQGPETIVEFLQRVGVPKGIAPGTVRVVRAHVADGKLPEVFHVDLNAIVLKKNAQSNLRLEAGDRIHFQRNRRSKMACLVPPWIRRLWGDGDESAKVN